MKRTGQVYKGFQQGTVIQRSVSNSFLESQYPGALGADWIGLKAG